MRTLTLLLATTGMIATPALSQTTTPVPTTAPTQTLPAPTMSPAVAPTPTMPAQAAPAQSAPAQSAPAQSAPATSATPGRRAMPRSAPTAAAATPAPTLTIAAALPTLPNHTTLVRLVTAAQLATELSGPGPFTLFAPNDAAFARLPAGTLDTLTAPSNLAGLQTIVKNHVFAGKLTEAELRNRIKAGGGRATLTMMSGQPLIASLENNVVLLTDPVGNKSFIDDGDMMETNGVIHVTNGISLPKLG